MKTEYTTYHKEMLTALYKSLDYMQAYNLPTAEVKQAIESIEKLYK